MFKSYQWLSILRYLSHISHKLSGSPCDRRREKQHLYHQRMRHVSKHLHLSSGSFSFSSNSKSSPHPIPHLSPEPCQSQLSKPGHLSHGIRSNLPGCLHVSFLFLLSCLRPKCQCRSFPVRPCLWTPRDVPAAKTHREQRRMGTAPRSGSGDIMLGKHRR